VEKPRTKQAVERLSKHANTACFMRGSFAALSTRLARMNRRNGSPMHPWHQAVLCCSSYLFLVSWSLCGLVVKIRQKTRPLNQSVSGRARVAKFRFIGDNAAPCARLI
jgi:hypothetical protein